MNLTVGRLGEDTWVTPLIHVCVLSYENGIMQCECALRGNGRVTGL
jgi:hypothetical protein